MLAVSAADGPPLLSHLPFRLNDAGTEADLHLVRSNPIARALRAGSLAARLAVSGPDGYVSPDWYGIPDQVPTWNYVAVHLTGRLDLRPPADLRQVIDRQSAEREDALRPKRPWTSDKRGSTKSVRTLPAGRRVFQSSYAPHAGTISNGARGYEICRLNVLLHPSGDSPKQASLHYPTSPRRRKLIYDKKTISMAVEVG